MSEAELITFLIQQVQEGGHGVFDVRSLSDWHSLQQHHSTTSFSASDVVRVLFFVPSNVPKEIEQRLRLYAHLASVSYAQSVVVGIASGTTVTKRGKRGTREK
jgi:hypothetical protein